MDDVAMALRKRDNPSWWAVWITLVTLAASGIAGFTSLEEAKQTNYVAHADYERRLRTIETDRKIEDRISALSVQIAKLEGLVISLRSEIAESEAHRRHR